MWALGLVARCRIGIRVTTVEHQLVAHARARAGDEAREIPVPFGRERVEERSDPDVDALPLRGPDTKMNAVVDELRANGEPAAAQEQLGLIRGQLRCA